MLIALLIASTITAGYKHSLASPHPSGRVSNLAALTTDVERVIKRHLGSSFTLSHGTDAYSRIVPTFVTGDFNGDGVEDLAALVLPNDEQISSDPEQAVKTLNQLTLVGKPLATGISARRYSDGRIPAVLFLRNYKAVPLLLIIHGVRGVGWTSITLKQRFLLAGLGDASAERMLTSREPLRRAVAGDEPEGLLPPSLRGDSIRFLDRKGRGEAIYWDGRLYRWYPME